MRIVFFADTHLGFDHPIHPRIARRRRGADFFSNYQTVLDHAVQTAADLLIHGGDMFFRSKIPPKIVELAYEPLLRVLDSGIKMLIVPGNHERSRLPAAPILKHPGLHLMDSPRSFSIESQGMRVRVGGFPNIRHDVQGRFSEAVAASGILDGPVERRILLLHQAIENAVVGVQNYRFRKGPDVISLNQFPPGLDLVLSGHIHRQQELRTSGGTPILYSGSIERTSFAERLEQKGFYEIFVEEGGLSRRFIPLPARPMVEIVLRSHLTDQDQIAAFLRSQASVMDNQSIVRVRPSTLLQAQLVGAAFLRDQFPSSMNVDLVFPRGLQLREEA
jgi:exonuclease SbcD